MERNGKYRSAEILPRITKRGLEEFKHHRVLRRDVMVDCQGLNNPRLKAKGTLQWKVASTRVITYGMEPQTAISGLDVSAPGSERELPKFEIRKKKSRWSPQNKSLTFNFEKKL